MGFPIGGQGIEEGSHQVETSEVNLTVLLSPICLFVNLKSIILQSTMSASSSHKLFTNFLKKKKYTPWFLGKVTSVEKIKKKWNLVSKRIVKGKEGQLPWRYRQLVFSGECSVSRFPWLPWREKQQVVLNQRAVGLKQGMRV